MSALTRAEVVQARAGDGRRSRGGFVPERRGHVVKLLHASRRRPDAVWPPRKEHAACCETKRLPDGRPVLGFCSPECMRRPGNWALVLEGKPIPKGGVPPRRP